jgi:hypothetical protein
VLTRQPLPEPSCTSRPTEPIRRERCSVPSAGSVHPYGSVVCLRGLPGTPPRSLTSTEQHGQAEGEAPEQEP